MDYLTYLKKLLDIAVKEEASDLDISVGHTPNIRITGQLVPLSQEKIIEPKDSEGLAFALMTEVQKKKFLLLESNVGEGIFFAGTKHVAIKVVASYSEDQIITTDPSQLLEIEQAKKDFEEENA